LGTPKPQKQKRGEGGAPSFVRFLADQDAQKATTRIRAQHSMMDGTSGLETEGKSARAHQIDNLERDTVSATVKGEVNSDFDCRIALSTAV
jgi:hypothetical protein